MIRGTTRLQPTLNKCFASTFSSLFEFKKAANAIDLRARSRSHYFLKSALIGQSIPSRTEYQNGVTRQAVLSDVASIWATLQEPMATGSVLPITFDYLRQHVSDFVVFCTEGKVVGFTAMKYYASSNTAELCKIVTSPEYRGRGIAKKLVVRAILQGMKEQLDDVFALSLDPAMIHVFKSLGFQEVSRLRLPEEWLANYDLSRPSQGFQFVLSQMDIEVLPANSQQQQYA